LRIIHGAPLAAILLASVMSQPARAQAQITIPGVGQLTVPGYGQAPPPRGYQPPPPAYSQAPPPGYGQGEGYDHDRWEHCQRLVPSCIS
jgi:hypothetical protein